MFRNLNQKDLEIINKNAQDNNSNLLFSHPKLYALEAKRKVQEAISKLLQINPSDDYALTEVKMNFLTHQKLRKVNEKSNSIDAMDYVVGYIQTLPKQQQIYEVFEIVCASCFADYFSDAKKTDEDIAKFNKVNEIIVALQNESFDFSVLKNIILKSQIESLKKLIEELQKRNIKLSNEKMMQIFGGYTLIYEKLENLSFYSPHVKNEEISDYSLTSLITDSICKGYSNAKDDSLEIIKHLIINDNCKTKEESILSQCLEESRQTTDLLNQLISLCLENKIAVDYEISLSDVECINSLNYDIQILINDFYGERKQFDSEDYKSAMTNSDIC